MLPVQIIQYVNLHSTSSMLHYKCTTVRAQKLKLSRQFHNLSLTATNFPHPQKIPQQSTSPAFWSFCLNVNPVNLQSQ